MDLKRDQARAAAIGARPSAPNRTQAYLASSSQSQRRSGTAQRAVRPAKSTQRTQDALQLPGTSTLR